MPMVDFSEEKITLNFDLSFLICYLPITLVKVMFKKCWLFNFFLKQNFSTFKVGPSVMKSSLGQFWYAGIFFEIRTLHVEPVTVISILESVGTL